MDRQEEAKRRIEARRKKRKQRQRRQRMLVCGIAGLVLLTVFFLIFHSIGSDKSKPEPTEPKEEKVSFFGRLFGAKEDETEPLIETQPIEPEHVVSTASIAATGDILMHMPIVNSCQTGTDSYQFDSIFQFVNSFISEADYAVANLETTLCGTENGYPYSGYPAFNCPDEIVDAAKNAGFDMLLTANNHCYDTGETGFLRTISTVQGRGLDSIGTMASKDAPKYLIKNINGIRVGMLCYTYEAPPTQPEAGRIYMNNIAMAPGSENLINSFLPSDINPFVAEISGYLEEMRNAGAEATIVFIHWGVEYETIPNDNQRIIAQELADLGVDVIIGGHPHVVQMVDMLNSKTDPNHKTVCLYSMGNFISNQRKEEMNLKSGHTEDGVLFQITFSKYSDNSVYLENVDILPLWVDKRPGTNTQYIVIPLDTSTREKWPQLYGLSEEGYNCALNSLERTSKIVQGGIERAQKYLLSEKELREAEYLAAISGADKAA